MPDFSAENISRPETKMTLARQKSERGSRPEIETTTEPFGVVDSPALVSHSTHDKEGVGV